MRHHTTLSTRRDVLAALASAISARAAEPGFERIETHTHMHRPAPAMLAMLQRDNWRCLSICDSRAVGDEPSILDDMIRGTEALHRESQGRIPWATTFDPRGFDSSGFAERTLAALRRDFAREAIAVKFWKNIGMAIQSKSGDYLMPDSPALTPIIDAIDKAGRTLITHLAEPDAAWRPLDANPDSNYYRNNPKWHMYGKPGIPSKSAILDSRDRLLARHPKLRVIGCHLGSNEDAIDQLAPRLDRYPNFAVDVASRVRFLARLDNGTVRQFLTKYQDRIIYATDFQLGPDDAKAAESLKATHDRDWAYFNSLELPAPVLRKIFRENAVRWLPGMTS